MAIWKDFDNDFLKQNDGDVKVMENYDAIGNSIINIIETMRRSRRMLPEFALHLHGLLFEPIDGTTASTIGRLILGALETWEPRIIVDNIHVHAVPDNNTYEISLRYRLVGTAKFSSSIQQLNTILRAR